MSQWWLGAHSWAECGNRGWELGWDTWEWLGAICWVWCSWCALNTVATVHQASWAVCPYAFTPGSRPTDLECVSTQMMSWAWCPASRLGSMCLGSPASCRCLCLCLELRDEFGICQLPHFLGSPSTHSENSISRYVFCLPQVLCKLLFLWCFFKQVAASSRVGTSYH